MIHYFTMNWIEELLCKEDACLIGVQEPLFAEDEPMVLFNFLGFSQVYGLKLSELTPEAVRNKRR